MIEGEAEGALRLFPGLPRRSFFSVAAFLGGIFFFLRRVGEAEKNTERFGGEEGTRRRGTARRRNNLESDRQNFQRRNRNRRFRDQVRMQVSG